MTRRGHLTSTFAIVQLVCSISSSRESSIHPLDSTTVHHHQGSPQGDTPFPAIVHLAFQSHSPKRLSLAPVLTSTGPRPSAEPTHSFIICTVMSSRKAVSYNSVGQHLQFAQYGYTVFIMRCKLRDELFSQLLYPSLSLSLLFPFRVHSKVSPPMLRSPTFP